MDEKRVAEAIATELNRRLQTRGLIDFGRGEMRLADYVETYWRLHAIPNLELATRKSYASVWANHLQPRLGDYRLREITPGLVTGLRAELLRHGVGEPTVRRALAVLQSILALAVREDRLDRNPVANVRKPSQTPSRKPQPLPPERVEDLRREMSPADAALVSVLAYAGLRPEEALALKWADVGERALMVQRKNVDGDLVPYTKTRSHRSVAQLVPQDLREHRLASGGRRGLVFPRSDGGPWRAHDYRNWRRRVFRPAADAAGLPEGMRPYDLRHSFVSLLIWEGRSVADVARQAGHSVETCSRSYVHVLEEYDPAKMMGAGQRIRQARERRGLGEAKLW